MVLEALVGSVTKTFFFGPHSDDRQSMHRLFQIQDSVENKLPQLPARSQVTTIASQLMGMLKAEVR